jgi:hypothetical protein
MFHNDCALLDTATTAELATTCKKSGTRHKPGKHGPANDPKAASKSRRSGEWNEDDYDVVIDDRRGRPPPTSPLL